MCSHESVCVCLWEFVDMDLVCTSVCIYTPVWYVHMCGGGGGGVTSLSVRVNV